MKAYLFQAILFLALICSCSQSGRMLDNAEKRMLERPEEIYEGLREMDTLSMSERAKARRALLQAYIATIYSMPADMSQADIERATASFDGKCNADEVKSLIIKSELAKSCGDNVGRLEMLKDAEFLANQLDDKLDQGFIYFYLSKVYANGFNGTVSAHYAQKALEIFNTSGYKKQSIDARMAIVGALAVKRDYKTALDSMLSMKEDVLAYSTGSYKKYFLDMLARMMDENGQSGEAIEIWRSIYEEEEPSANTLAHWANAYLHNGQADSAEILISRAIEIPHNTSDEYLCRNVQYMIAERLGNDRELQRIDSLREEAAKIDYDGRKIAESSLALNLKYDSATLSAWKELQRSRQRTSVIAWCSVLIILLLSGGILYIRKRNKFQQVEIENKLMRLQNHLFERECEHNAIAERIKAQFKAPFSTIDRLARAYFESKETPQEQKRIHAEAKTAIDEFCSAESIAKMEEIINSTQDRLMQHFDEDFPNVTDAQRRLALYLFCGMTLQSISIFQKTELRNIYVYKSRLKSTILKSGSPRKDIYLSYFG